MTPSTLLKKAMSQPELLMSMTAFLMEVRVDCGCASGRVYADVLERFIDGTPMRTADIESLVLRQGFWSFQTADFERYAIVSFDGKTGRESFVRFALLMLGGVYHSSSSLQ